ncbi:nucleotidyltransferase domain-containing protein [Candidatus Pacearchaeota archaeon]|nr:nucleotidyltransferase domain-containing protein [Candidatus Pacearchaeota archaeon]
MAKKEDLKIVKEFKKKISEKIPVKKVILFGSRATGKTHEWSDYDIIVVSDEFEGEKTFERGIGFYDYWEHDYPVDFLCYTIAEFNRLKKKATIVKEAMKEGIEIK